MRWLYVILRMMTGSVDAHEMAGDDAANEMAGGDVVHDGLLVR